jgi:hypothetical protein
MSERDFVCRAAHPAVNCGYPEVFAFTGLGVLQAVVCLLYCVRHHFDPLPFSGTGSDYFLWFWCGLFLYSVYHTVVVTAYLPYTPVACYLVQAFDGILQMLPTWVVILMLSEMLFTYRNPGRTRVLFARICLALFVLVFLLLGVLFSFTDVEDMLQPGDSMLLWQGAIRLLTAVFLALPAVKLYSAITYPVLQQDDVSCVRSSAVVFGAFAAINVARSAFVLTQFCDLNKWAFAISQAVFQNPADQLPVTFRAVFWILEFLSNTLYTALLMVAVLVLRDHERRFANDPFYAQFPNEGDRPAKAAEGGIAGRVKKTASDVIGRLSGTGRTGKALLEEESLTDSKRGSGTSYLGLG